MKFLKHGAIGLGIGSTINLMMVAYYQGSQTREQIISVLVMSALIGLLANIFSLEKGSLLLKSLIQFIGSLVLFLVTAVYNRWIDATLTTLVSPLVVFLAVFMTTWVVFYQIEKKECEQINQALKKRQ